MSHSRWWRRKPQRYISHGCREHLKSKMPQGCQSSIQRPSAACHTEVGGSEKPNIKVTRQSMAPKTPSVKHHTAIAVMEQLKRNTSHGRRLLGEAQRNMSHGRRWLENPRYVTWLSIAKKFINIRSLAAVGALGRPIVKCHTAIGGPEKLKRNMLRGHRLHNRTST